jgi:hypothetical protein
MTHEDLTIKRDRMRYTKDKFSANMIIVAIVLDALYFISIYKTDVSNWYYTWLIGASIVYNLLFLLTAFLCSEGVKNRKGGYTVTLIVIGLMQLVRISYLPMKAHAAVVEVAGVETIVMDDKQFLYTVACLAVSGICCIIGAISSYINNKNLAEHMRAIENNKA